MRILSLTTIYPHEEMTAEGRSVAFLDQALVRQGVQGTTLVLKPWAPQWLASRVEKWKHLAVRERTAEQDGLRIVFSPYFHVPVRFQRTLCVYSMAHQAIRLIRKQGLEFNLVHGQSIYPAALAARLVAEKCQVPFVVTLRDDLTHLSSWYDQLGARELFEPMFASVSAIFVHGPSLLRDVSKFIPPGAHPKILMAPNGVDIEGIQVVLDSLGPAPQHPWGSIVSVGNLYRFKGIHENLLALKLLNEQGLRVWKYTVVGDGPHRKELGALTKELGLEQQVSFVGRVSHKDAIRYIRDADIFSLPSWAEPFGNVYAEAAMCARPSVGCKGFGPEITIRDRETGFLVPPKDVEALADALGFLLRYPDQARKMGQAAGVFIQQFTWGRTANLYKQVIAPLILEKQLQND